MHYTLKLLNLKSVHNFFFFGCVKICSTSLAKERLQNVKESLLLKYIDFFSSTYLNVIANYSTSHHDCIKKSCIKLKEKHARRPKCEDSSDLHTIYTVLTQQMKTYVNLLNGN